MNNKGQFGLIGIDALSLPNWLLYPLLIVIILLMISVIVFMSLFTYKCLLTNQCTTMPMIGYFGWHGFPIGVWSNSYSYCLQNGVQVNCANLNVTR